MAKKSFRLRSSRENSVLLWVIIAIIIIAAASLILFFVLRKKKSGNGGKGGKSPNGGGDGGGKSPNGGGDGGGKSPNGGGNGGGGGGGNLTTEQVKALVKKSLANPHSPYYHNEVQEQFMSNCYVDCANSLLKNGNQLIEDSLTGKLRDVETAKFLSELFGECSAQSSAENPPSTPVNKSIGRCVDSFVKSGKWPKSTKEDAKKAEEKETAAIKKQIMGKYGVDKSVASCYVECGRDLYHANSEALLEDQAGATGLNQLLNYCKTGGGPVTMDACRSRNVPADL